MVTQNQKRQRQRQSRQSRQAAVVAARRKRNRRNRILVSGFLALIVVVGVLVVVGGGTKSSDKASSTAAPACPKPDGSSPPTRTFAKAPNMCIDPAKAYTAEIVTNKGTMVATLDPKAAPRTVNNFVFLARYHFYDGLKFHRVVAGFVLQGGDPQGDGSGGPGYEFPDELPPAGRYKVGSLAMANSGPNTNGSQFFVISGDKGTSLEPKYSLFGQVTQGLDVVAAIDALGTQNETPSQPVTIESVKIKES